MIEGAAILRSATSLVDQLFSSARLIQIVRDATVRRVQESIVPNCLRWLGDQGHWGNECSITRALNEICASLRDIAPSEPKLPAAAQGVRPQAWVLPAALGAGLGPFALLPLMFLLPNSGEILLYLGGILGSAGLVGLIGLVASRPSILAGIENGLKWAGIIVVPIAFWRSLRGRPFGWVRAAVSTLGAWLVLATVRPRTRLPSRDDVLAALRAQVRGLLLHEADMALARCWSHPDRLGRLIARGHMMAELSGSVWRSLGDLRTMVRDTTSTREDVVDAAEVLLQRLEDAGYHWIDVAWGTPYSESLEPYFEKFGMIEVGQPVEMIQSALCKQDGAGKSTVAVEPGMLRRAHHRGV
jgi:hypothetical protein